MLKKTTLSLSRSLIGSSVLAIVLSIFIVLMLGGIGAKPSTSSSSTSNTSAISSSSVTSSSASSASSSVSSSSAASSAATSSSAQVAFATSEGGLISYPAGRVSLGLICVLIYFGLVYSTAWREGNRDPNRVKYGHIKKFMAKGFVAGLIASIPYFIITTLFVISRASAESTFGTVMNIIYRFVNIQYVVFGDGFLKYPICCFALLLVLPVAAELGYLAGYRNLIIITKIVYKNQKKKDGSYRKSIKNLKR